MGKGEGVVGDRQLVVADGGRELRGELSEVGEDVVGEMVFEGSTTGVEVLLVPTSKLRPDVGLYILGDRAGLEEVLVENSSGGVWWRLETGEGGVLALGYGGVGRHMEIREEDAPRGREWGGEA